MTGSAARLRPVAGGLAAFALAVAVMTGCTKDDQGAAAPGTGKPGAGSSSPSQSATGGSGGTGGGGGSTGDTGASGGKAPAKKPTGNPSPPKAPDPGSPDCADKPPTPDEVDPDEIAVYRTEEIEADGAHLNLIIQHGAWGCPGKDTDGPPFVTTGEESRWALDQAAYVSAVTPITETTENQRIGVQELVDWINAHPNSGLVFRYQTGDDGAIHRLEQVFTP